MVALRAETTVRRIEELRRELTDLAFMLDRRGQPAAADVALAIAGRLDEIVAGGASNQHRPGADRPRSDHL